MLTNLHVKNLALIKDIEISLDRNLNILSGETGAGKSILLGSVNLALGCRADADLIRTGEEEAFVELVFSVDNVSVLRALEKLDVYPENGLLIITRRIRDKSSVCKINGETVTQKLLRDVSEMLIDIHGQHEHQSLLHEENHIKVLDAFGKEELKSAKEVYLAAYQSFKKKKEEIRAFDMDPDELRQKIDFLSYEINEIEQAKIVKGEEERLTAEFTRLQHGKQIADGLSEIESLLSDDTEDRILRAVRASSKIEAFDSGLNGLTVALTDLQAVLQDTINDTKNRLIDAEPDEERLQALDERLDLLDRLKRKYGGSEAEILKTYAKLSDELEALETFEENRESVMEALKDEQRKLVEAAKALHETRLQIALRFDTIMVESLQNLNFNDVRFETEVQETNRFTSEGADEVRFMISTNIGEPVKPLSKVASGGELSRIMLAIKTLIARTDDIDTLIFDEIDSGISGKTAGAVALKMGEIAKNHQVICISHLPQIVAMADHHYKIAKTVRDNETVTEIRELDPDGSLQELARLFGAGEVTENSLMSAAELRKTLKEGLGRNA